MNHMFAKTSLGGDARYQPHEPSAIQPTREATTYCDICADHLPVHLTSKLACGTTWCKTCLERIFEQSITNPSTNMPPKCCRIMIATADVAHLLDQTLQSRWNTAAHEYEEDTHIYCPNPTCSTRLKSSDMALDGASAICDRCGTQVCAKCKHEVHAGRACEATMQDKEMERMAEEQGWKKCWKCTAVVSKSAGCDHMTCTCGAEFCYACGARYEKGAATCVCAFEAGIPAVYRGRRCNANDDGAANDGEAVTVRSDHPFLSFGRYFDGVWTWYFTRYPVPPM